MRSRAVGAGIFGAGIFAAFVFACGESRRPIGEECLRDEDCLSSVCASRSCVSAPTLVSGTSGASDETPRLASDDAAAPPVDASGGS